LLGSAHAFRLNATVPLGARTWPPQLELVALLGAYAHPTFPPLPGRHRTSQCGSGMDLANLQTSALCQYVLFCKNRDKGA
jgi:hypothetical protein